MLRHILSVVIMFSLIGLVPSFVFGSVSDADKAENEQQAIESNLDAGAGPIDSKDQEPKESEASPEAETQPPTASQPSPIPEGQGPSSASDTAAKKTIQSTNEDEINPCLLDPSLPSCPKPDENQDCPEGWAQNEDGNCFPLHPDGCPSGYHGHEDDETGRCIPNSTPCDPLYILVSGENGRKNCERKEFYCQTHENDNQCKPPEEEDNQDHDKEIIIKQIHNTKIIKQIQDSNEDLNLKETVIAINYIDGVGINCVIEDDEDGQCETFTVTKDPKKIEPLLVVIPFN